MKKYLRFRPEIFFGFILSAGFYLYFAGSNISDQIVAKSIPQYPHTIQWRITSSLGFPDGHPNAEIYFSTHDQPRYIVEYYQSALSQKGWQMVSTPTKFGESQYFEKTIGDQQYKVYLNRKASLWYPSNDWWISIGHYY